GLAQRAILTHEFLCRLTILFGERGPIIVQHVFCIRLDRPDLLCRYLRYQVKELQVRAHFRLWRHELLPLERRHVLPLEYLDASLGNGLLPSQSSPSPARLPRHVGMRPQGEPRRARIERVI